MAQRVYATVAEYATFTADGTTTTDAILRRASGVIDALTRTAVYDVDVDDMPTDADVSQAFTDATCAQVAYWDVTDDVTGAESQTGPTRIGSVSFGGSCASGGASNGKSASGSRFAPEAVQILTNAGLITATVSH